MLEKKENNPFESIIDVDYENHFKKEFDGQSINLNKNIKSRPEDIFQDFSTGINTVFNSVKKEFNDFNIRRKLNFTILDYEELLDLKMNYEQFARKLGFDIGLIIASVGFITLAFINILFLFFGVIFIFIAVLLIIKHTITFNNKYSYLNNKNIQLSNNDYDYLCVLADNHKQNNVKAILGLLSSIFIPLIILVTTLIITQGNATAFIPILAMFFISLGIGVGNIIHYGLISSFYNQILNGKPFRQ